MTHRLIVGGEILLYGDVGDLWGDGSGFTDREVLEALAAVGDQDIAVRINSGGGNAWMGFAIYNSLRAHPGKVTIYVDAMAASAASVIAMAGDEIVMAEDALMMIHDPATVTWGTAANHQSSVEHLSRLADRSAEIYARKAGGDAQHMRDLMLAETWFTAAEAVDVGLADTVSSSAAIQMSAFDYGAFSHAPSSIPSQARRSFPKNAAVAASPSLAATAAPENEVIMTEPVQAAVEAAPVVPAAPALDRAGAIFERCSAARLTMEETASVMSGASGDEDRARDLITAALVARDPSPQTAVASIPDGGDERDRFKTGLEKALLLKAGMDGGESNEFTGMTLKEMARASLMIAGRRSDASVSDPLQMIGNSFVSMSGQHTNSDFVNVLANIANKSMLRGYGEAEETFEQWTARGVLPDFKASTRVDLGVYPSLTEVPEGAEYTNATINDRGETIQLATYGSIFSISRHAIINDDLGVFTRIPQRMGRAAHRTVGNLVYAILNDNPAMSDSKALFHADHANLMTAGSALSVANIDAARAKMAKQKDGAGHAVALNIRPRFLIVPVELEGTARVLLESEFDPAQTQRVPNAVRGIATLVSDARLSGAGWFLASDPVSHDTIEVAYLNGNSAPVLEQQNGFRVDGVEFKVRMDAGVKALDYRGLLKATGAN